MRLAAAVILLVGATATARAELLFCEGQAYSSGGEIPATRALDFDPKTLVFSVSTSFGKASGTAKAETELYLGELYTADGKGFWFNLNRFNGDFVVVQMPAKNTYGIGEFHGNCRKAERKF